MNINKRKFCAFLILTLLSILTSNVESQFLDLKSSKVSKRANIMGELSLRNLEQDPESLIAYIYTEPYFQGFEYAVLSGNRKHFLTQTISLRVGQATLRIVDEENNWVYRFAPGEEVREFKLKTRHWYALIGKPRAEESCALLFQRPNYSGYYEEICLEADEWFQGKLFERRYTSITLPNDNSIEFATLLGENNEFQVFNYRSAFSGDLNYVYIFGAIDRGTGYIFTSKSVEYIEVEAGVVAGFEVDQGRYFLVSGKDIYMKIDGTNTKIVVSKDKQFDYVNTYEITTARARDLSVSPDSGEVFFYEDIDGLLNFNAESYGDYDYPYVVQPTDFEVNYIVFPIPNDSVAGVLINYSSGKNIIIRSEGRIPEIDGDQESIAIVPAVDADEVEIYTNAYFGFKTNTIASVAQGDPIGVSDPILSILVGENIKVYLAALPNYDNVLVFQPGSINFDLEPISNYAIYFNKQDMFDVIIDSDCVRLYTSCDDDLNDFQEICIDDPLNYKNINLSEVKMIAFHANPSFQAVLLYRPDSFDGQFTYAKTTCLRRELSEDLKITLIPTVADQYVIYYDDYFYSGTPQVLSVEDIYIIDETVEKISIAFGPGSFARLIDVEDRTVAKLDFNAPKYHTKGHKISLQISMNSVVNAKSQSLWTFDDAQYSDMRILYGGLFYGERTVSYATRYLVFPKKIMLPLNKLSLLTDVTRLSKHMIIKLVLFLLIILLLVVLKEFL